MITELTNQDPLNPMDNTQLVQQIGELRAIAATDQLTGTLQSLQTEQSLTTASSLIGKRVTALSTDNENITGIVDQRLGRSRSRQQRPSAPTRSTSATRRST